jgi:hypothetical protein
MGWKLALVCGVAGAAVSLGGCQEQSPADFTKFTGTTWSGTNTIAETCGGATATHVESFTVQFSPNGDNGIDYPSKDGCVFDFTVSGDTATLSNAPVTCSGMFGDAGVETYTVTTFTLTTDGHSLTGTSTYTGMGVDSCTFTATFALSR